MSITQCTEVWCLLIDHQKHPSFGGAFSVTVSSDDTIYALTVKIKENQLPLLADIPPNCLNVWKLYKPRSARDVIRPEFLTTVKLLHKPCEDETARLLEPTNEILSEGPWPTRMIHVLVEVPTGALHKLFLDLS
jgi:Crinkler effector protein N-terminal domain